MTGGHMPTLERRPKHLPVQPVQYVASATRVNATRPQPRVHIA